MVEQASEQATLPACTKEEDRGSRRTAQRKEEDEGSGRRRKLGAQAWMYFLLNMLSMLSR